MEIAVTLVIAGLVAGLYLSYVNSRNNSMQCYEATRIQLRDIAGAIERFVQKNDRYPLPALRTAGVEDPSYGREVPLASIGQLDTTVAAPTVTMGALPFQALGLAPSYAGDCFGDKFTYAVTTDLTDSTKYLWKTPVYDGAITIKDSGTSLPSLMAYTVITHGANGIGSVKLNYNDTSAIPNKHWCTYNAATDSLEKQNCAAPTATFINTVFNDGKSAVTDGYDDLIVYNAKHMTPVAPCTCKPGRGPNNIFTTGAIEIWTASPHCN